MAPRRAVIGLIVITSEDQKEFHRIVVVKPNRWLFKGIYND